ncbi:MAG TPA: PD-(D/E)XK nuclease family protein [Rhabdochlamydiaceae bacterium]
MKLTAAQIGLERISPSQLDCYEQCPRLFYYRDWLKLTLDQDKIHLDYGTAIHAALEFVYTEYDNNFGGGWQAGNFDKVVDAFLMYWKQHHVSEASYEKVARTKFGQEMGFKNKEALYEYMKEDGIKMLKSYWDNKELLLTKHGIDLVEFEIPMRVPMINPSKPDERLPIPLSLRIDAETRNKLKGVDFKTSKSKYDPVETRKKIQGQCYCFAKGYREFDYIVLRKDLKSDDRIEVVSLVYDEADMQAFYHRVEAILANISQRNFDKPMRGHANYCDCIKYEELLSVRGISLNPVLSKESMDAAKKQLSS